MCFPCFRRRLCDLHSAFREIEAIFQPEKANIGVDSIHTTMKTLMMISFRMMMVVMMMMMMMVIMVMMIMEFNIGVDSMHTRPLQIFSMDNFGLPFFLHRKMCDGAIFSRSSRCFLM